MIGIYKIVNNTNGKIYVGQSIDIERRIKSHRCVLNHNRHINKHLQSAWNIDTESSFVFSVVEECPKKQLDEREAFWISKWNTCDSRYGYNFRPGGNSASGFTMSKDACVAISKSLTGIKRSRSTKEKVSKAFKGKQQWSKPRGSSKYHGVYFRKDTLKWSSELNCNEIKYRLGCYDTEREAAMAYDEKAIELFGDKCFTNFDKDGNDINYDNYPTSSYQGVKRLPNGKWMGYITVNGKKRSVGCFATDKEASIARNKVVAEMSNSCDSKKVSKYA